METNGKPTAQKLYEILTLTGFTTRDEVETLNLVVLRNIARNAGIEKRITPRHRDQLLAHFPDLGAADSDPFAGLT